MTPSPIGFGAFKIGRNESIKYPHAYDLPPEQDVHRLLNAVLDAGINVIDTAPAYGMSEERIGRAIAHRRDAFILSTKVGEDFLHGVSTYDYSRDAVRASVHRSLRRLRTDVLDLVFIHANRHDQDILQTTDVVETLLALRDHGVTRGIGLSGYTEPACRAALTWADAVMVTYHRDDVSLAPIIDEAAAAGVQVFVKKGLASGRLAPDDAIPFVLGNPGVACVVVGGLSIGHIRDNIRIARRVRGNHLVGG